MAIVTIVTARNVGWMFARRGDTVVTGAAAAQYLCVVDSYGWYPHRDAVTVLAHIGCQHVSRVLAGRSYAVVAVAAVTDNAGVIKVRGQPAIGGVAVLANIAGIDMCRMFAGGRNPVMTTAAIADDADVIKVGRNPPGSSMAVVTGIGACHVRRRFAGGRHAIMARPTGADDLSVVNCQCRRKGHDAVTILANRCGLDMRRVLASCIRTVVTTHAVARDIDVIKVRWCPGNSRVAVVAGFATRYVRRRFAGSDIAVVT